MRMIYVAHPFGGGNKCIRLQKSGIGGVGMTRQEAVERLMAEVSRIEEIMENGDFGCVDMDTWNKFNSRKEWRQELIALIKPPMANPATGLVPCGCGGKAGFHYSVMMRDNDCYVECGICGVHTKVVLSEDKARDAWNRAMGFDGEATDEMP